jgi:hypothetical protein
MLTLIAFALVSSLVGMVLGQRFKVLVLLPAMAISLLLAIGTGLAHGERVGPIMLLAVAALASLQIGYLAGVGVRHSLAATRMSGLRTDPLSETRTARPGAR